MSNVPKVAGVVTTTHPTALPNGQPIKAAYDGEGRQIVMPFCARGLIATAVCTVQNSAAVADCETLLIAGDTTNFLDPYYVYASNASTNAIRIVLRTGSAGTDIMALDIAANGVSSIQPPLPYPQSEKSQGWYVDFGVNASILDVNDVTNTAVVVGGFFIRNG